VGLDCINLSTLHIANGRKFTIVVLYAMYQGRILSSNVGWHQILKTHRLFYVGFKRAKSEVHMNYSAGNPSVFITEVHSDCRPPFQLARVKTH